LIVIGREWPLAYTPSLSDLAGESTRLCTRPCPFVRRFRTAGAHGYPYYGVFQESYRKIANDTVLTHWRAFELKETFTGLVPGQAYFYTPRRRRREPFKRKGKKPPLFLRNSSKDGIPTAFQGWGWSLYLPGRPKPGRLALLRAAKLDIPREDVDKDHSGRG